MRARRHGSIINLGSITWHAGFANVAAYATAKAAIEGLTRSLARDLGSAVVNAASGPDADTSAAQAGLMAALDRGLGVLAVHVGACTLLRLPEWESVTGAAWISGRSMHPKVGPCRIITYPGRHPICAPVADFDITDERYAHLRTAPDIVPLAAHEHAGEVHPLLWARIHQKSRIVTDLLGHDERSYDSPEHRQLVSRAARWLTLTGAM